MLFIFTTFILTDVIDLYTDKLYVVYKITKASLVIQITLLSWFF